MCTILISCVEKVKKKKKYIYIYIYIWLLGFFSNCDVFNYASKIIFFFIFINKS